MAKPKLIPIEYGKEYPNQIKPKIIEITAHFDVSQDEFYKQYSESLFERLGINGI